MVNTAQIPAEATWEAEKSVTKLNDPRWHAKAERMLRETAAWYRIDVATLVAAVEGARL